MKIMKTAALLMSLVAGMVLTASASLVVLSNNFTSGATTGWVNSGGTLTVVNDAGIGGGNAMNIVTTSGNKDATKAFSQAVTLGAGDYISITMDYRFTYTTNVNAGVQFRFLDSTDGSYSAFGLNPGSTAGSSSWFSRTGITEGSKFANTFTNDLTADTMTYKVERTLDDKLTYTVSWVGHSSITKTSAVVTNPSDFTFDSLQIAFTSASRSTGFLVDNVVVTTSIPEPATIGMLGLGALITMLMRRMRS